jgi:hypothetical protein
LIAMSDTPEQRAGGGGEQQAFGRLQDPAVGGDRSEGEGKGKDGALDRDQRRQRVVPRLARLRSPRQRDDRKPHCRDDHADPLPAAEVKAEVALGEHGEEDESAREHGLHARQLRERECTDMERPGADRHRPAHREPLGGEQAGGASQRVCGADRRCQDRPALLQQEGDVRRQCRRQR